MRNLVFALAAIAFAAPCVCAADAAASLEFYKKQALTLSAEPGREERAFAKTLADGLGTWAKQNAKQPAVKDALLLQARLYVRAEDYDRALITLFKLRHLYPEADLAVLNPLMADAVLAVNSKQRDQATALFTAPLSADEKTPAQRQAQALFALSKLSGRNFYEPAAEAFEEFFVAYPNYESSDLVELWYGDLHRVNGNYLAAISQYKKAGELYPKTPYRAASLRLIGDIYADNLKDTANAMGTYTQVLREFPGSSETGIVYKHMAILDENNKQYDSALINYDKAIELLGSAPAAYEAYQGKADVYTKTKNYDAAYNTLHQMSNVFSASESYSMDALLKAAELARKKMRDQNKYIQSLEKALLSHPQSPKAPQLMYDLGRAYEQQNRDAQAAEMYRKLIISHPTDKIASSAQSRLSRLEK